jgi:hypothetical protein
MIAIFHQGFFSSFKILSLIILICNSLNSDKWRMSSKAIGLETEVVSNHFLVNTDNMLEVIYQYDVKLFRHDRDGNLSENMAATEDFRITTEIMKLFRSKHAEWNNNGWTYDSRSTVFTSADLLLPDPKPEKDGNAPVGLRGGMLQEDVVVPGRCNISIHPSLLLIPSLMISMYVPGLACPR